MVVEINSGFLFGGTDCKGPEGRLRGADNLPNTDLEGGQKTWARLCRIYALYCMDAVTSITQLYLQIWGQIRLVRRLLSNNWPKETCNAKAHQLQSTAQATGTNPAQRQFTWTCLVNASCSRFLHFCRCHSVNGTCTCYSERQVKRVTSANTKILIYHLSWKEFLTALMIYGHAYAHVRILNTDVFRTLLKNTGHYRQKMQRH